MESFPLDTVPEAGEIHMACFTSVKNAADLKERFQAQDKSLTVAMIESTLIMDVIQLLLAANRAAQDHAAGKLKTQTLSSEIVYNLSPTTNIAESLKRFGISESTTSLVAIKIGGEAEEVMEEMSKTVDGNLVSFSKLDQEKDIEKLRKYYKIDPKAKDDKTILNWIIGAMAMKSI
ncbi:hypothetical protein BGW38_002151 [Lunasporangiospora selenospora]|uniref:EKC/KEOPS complex subunit CGI121 n=1 Tax=Lunasporangiospora selenospora TaxID=979761 RepID=A0A9P6KI13_9FUNG|nr:hypothetical protein BGW38_002151 [Lunasporangiospora selenospora]